ncbi:MAG TPA: hypothetical protein VMZ06_05860 [Candidatus Bathyarchaeia archaeon]|nr:hypothetical protein [Candidatus Bathyarchaeia archaeon]
MSLCLFADRAFAEAEKAAEPSESTFRDAILGRIELTEAQRESLDLNDDGFLDTSDLVVFLKGTGSETPIASFETVSSIAVEGSGTATVSVVLSTQIRYVRFPAK